MSYLKNQTDYCTRSGICTVWEVPNVGWSFKTPHGDGSCFARREYAIAVMLNASLGEHIYVPSKGDCGTVSSILEDGVHVEYDDGTQGFVDFEDLTNNVGNPE